MVTRSIRYNINRRVADQPAVAHGEFFRIAQEYWNTWDDMVECWNHSTGFALLGDGLANMGLGSGTLPGIALTEHTQFDVASPAQFQHLSARLQGAQRRHNHPLHRLRHGQGPGWDQGLVRQAFADLGKHPLLREHVFGTTVNKVIKFGMVGKLPNEEMLSYDWNLELWFDSNEEARTFLSSEPFTSMFTELRNVSAQTLGGLFRGQEMLMLNKALPHRDD